MSLPPLNQNSVSELQLMVNLNQVVLQSDSRVTELASQTIGTLQSALKESQETNKILLERIANLLNENELLKRTNQQLKQAVDSEKKVREDNEIAQKQFKNELVAGMHLDLNKIQTMTTEAESSLKTNFEGLTPTSASHVRAKVERDRLLFECIKTSAIHSVDLLKKMEP